MSELTPEEAEAADLEALDQNEQARAQEREEAGLTDEEKAHQHDDWQDDEHVVGVFCPFCGQVLSLCGHRPGG